MNQPSANPPPSFQDWMLLAINLAFVAMGLVILPNERDTGIVTLAFFGSCLFVSAGVVLRKLRFRRFSGEQVEVVGGVPLRPKTGFMQLIALWLLVLGITLYVFGHHYPLLFRLIGLFVAVVGAALLVASLTRQWPGGYLQFDPDAFTIATRKWRTRIAWDDIASVRQGDYHSNPVLLIDVHDPLRLVIEPPDAREAAMKAIGKSQAYMGADFAIMTSHYGIDLPVLSASVARYAEDATARAGLRRRLSD